MTTQTTQTQQSRQYNGELLDPHPSVEKGCLFFLTKMKETLLMQHYAAAMIVPALFLFMLAAPIQETEAAATQGCLYLGTDGYYCINKRNWENIELLPGQEMRSKNGAFVGIMQEDCNFVIYNIQDGIPHRENAIWSTDTHRNISPCKLAFQTDGNLVIYNKNDNSVWSTNTHTIGSSEASLWLQDDGNLVIYEGSIARETKVKWASNVIRNVPKPPCDDCTISGMSAEEKQKVLKEHNDERQKFSGSGVAPLQWSDELAAYSQQWAQETVDRKSAHHNPAATYPENLFAGEPFGQGGVAMEQRVHSWLYEKTYYDFSQNRCNAPTGKTCGHYLAIIKKDYTHVGCGFAKSEDWMGFVCSYDSRL